jgi:hypothetical protein
MNSASTRETNPAPVAGSEDIHNDVITTKDLSMSTGAGDARTDWEMFSQQALIGVGLFPVTAGMDTARWATALAMDKTQAMQWTRYQTFWASQFQAFVTMTLKAGEKWGGQKFESYEAQISIDTLSLVDFPGIVSSLSGLIGTAITPMVAGGTMPNNTARVILRDLWKVALQALGVSNVDQITSDEIFEITPSEVKREYAGAMKEFAELARRVQTVLDDEQDGMNIFEYDPDQPRDDAGRFGSGSGDAGGGDDTAGISGTATGGKDRVVAGKKINTAAVVNAAIADTNKAKLDMDGAEKALKSMGHTKPDPKIVKDYATQKDLLARLEKATGANVTGQVGKWEFTNAQTIHDSFDSYLSRRVSGQHARWTAKTKRY